MLKREIPAILVILAVAGSLLAGTTGKIAGRITDSESGEGLPGANVAIVGTSKGAATDVDGNYTILNIPPGLYTVRITFIGYQTVTMREVRVNIDFTTRIDQAVSPATIEMAEIEVFGERNPLVRQDLTNTLVAVTAEQIQALPVDQISQVVALTAGVTQDNSGGLHIRGGRSNEIAYQVNGLSINNPFSNNQGVGLATNAVQEVSVSAGTFSAEYGNALSGVVNFVTKEGGPEYNGSLRVWSGDHASSSDDIFFNVDDIDAFNHTRAEWTLGGPVPLFGNNLTFFVSGVKEKDDGFLYGIRVYNRNDLLFFDGDDILIDPVGLPETVGDLINGDFSSGNPGADGDRALVPMVTRDDLNITGKLTWKPGNTIKISYDLLLDDGERHTQTSFRRWRFTPDGRPKVFTNNWSHSIGLTHAISEHTFYTLKLGLNSTRRRQMVFEDLNDPRYFPVVDNLVTNHIIQPTETYVAGGNDLFRSTEQSRSILAKLDVVSQVVPNHEVKFGGEFVRHDLELESFDMLFDFDKGRFIIPLPELNPSFFSYQAYDHQPVQASFYILDKMELAKRFILNAGLRYDYLDTKAQFNPDLSGSVDDGVANPDNLTDSEAKHRFSPRLSLSFPITDRGIIRFSYGFFYQYPTFSQIYRNPRFEDFDFRSTPTFGNANLNPEKSIQYEMGLQQQFTDNLKIDLTVFYKDVNDLIQSRRVIAGDVALEKKFNVITNISYASVKGFTVSILKRKSPGGIFSATVDYTFQVAEGAFTDPTKLAADTRTGRVAEQEFVPLSYDRTHTVNATLTLSKARNWALSAIANLQAGTPFTPQVPSSVQAVEFDVNSATKPAQKNVDLKLEKFFRAPGGVFSVFMQVDNLLDWKDERFVHTNTGRSLTSLDETTQPNRFNNLKDKINSEPGNFFPTQFLDDFYQREDWLSAPREIRMGMTFEF